MNPYLYKVKLAIMIRSVVSRLHFLRKRVRFTTPLTLVLLAIFLTTCNPEVKQKGSWRVYKADAAGSNYSSLQQINDKNVDRLKVTWIFDPNDAQGNFGWYGSQSNPIVIDTMMYVTSKRNILYALHAATGKQIWDFDPFGGGQHTGEGGQSRGVVYWQDKEDKRILFTAGHYLIAVDAITGKAILTFGKAGKVDLNIGMRDDPARISVVATSPGIVYKNLLILGAWSSDSEQGIPGYNRAFDVRTGELVWTFHTIPLPGERGYETWPKDAWKYVGAANDWGGMTLDEKRGIVFSATGSASYDYYGANRLGQNLFANCVIAIEAATGKLLWYFQTVHHDLWDYDLPSAPNLVTINKDGKKIDAVAQLSKTGFIYILNRETGEPVYPIEERPVPASDVPGEEAWPTQPFPLKPKPFSRQHITEEDLNDITESGHDFLVNAFRSYRYEGIFTPPSLKGSLSLPASVGGAEWGGGAYDKEAGILYVKSNNSAEIALLKDIGELGELNPLHSPYQEGKIIYATYCSACHGDQKGGSGNFPPLINIRKKLSQEAALDLIKKGSGKMPSFAGIIRSPRMEKAIIDFLYERKDDKFLNTKLTPVNKEKDSTTRVEKEKKPEIKYRNVTAYRSFTDPDGNPGIKPPYGILNAINLNTGEYEWETPVGTDPKLQKPGEPPTGLVSMTGPMATAGGLVFLAGTRDKKFRAFDKTNGKLLWEIELPGVGSSNSSTYSVDGIQYIAISVSPNEKYPSGCIVVFSL